jgi:hypothetical protein
MVVKYGPRIIMTRENVVLPFVSVYHWSRLRKMH